MDTMQPWTRLILIASLALLPMLALAFEPPVVPGRYIVELEDAASLRFQGGQVMQRSNDGPVAPKTMMATAPVGEDATPFDARSASVRVYAAHLDRQRAAVLERAEFSLGRRLAPERVYRHVLNGFSAQLTDDEAQALAALPGVRTVEPVILHRLLDDNGPQWIGANRVWTGQFGTPVPNRGEGMVLGLIDSGINWDSPYFSDTPDGFEMINPRGEFFGLCGDPEVQCNNKLIGVYDFTTEDTKGRDIDGHGSHVGSTAVGSPLRFEHGFGLSTPIFFSSSGVAPRASVISYKVCEGGNPDDSDDLGGCPSDALIAALEQAVIDQVDVINYSIGSSGGTAPPPWAGFGQADSDREALLNLRAAGIVPVVAAGNSGPLDETMSAPGNVPWVLAVANVTHDRRIGARLTDLAGGDTPPLEVIGNGLTDESALRRIVHASDFGFPLCGSGPAELSLGCEAESAASNPFPPGTFNGEIVVCDRGIYGRIEKGRNVLAAGASGMILANTPAQGNETFFEQHCVPTLHVDSSTGDSLRQWLAAGSSHQGRFSTSDLLLDPDSGGRLASTSARGPVFGAPNLMKPNLAAPGTDILGASADGANGVAFLSGTSMASPHAAGAALLLRRAFPDWSVSAVITALETTADPTAVVSDDGTSPRVIDSGAGGLRVDRAARAGLYLPVTESEFLAADPAAGGDPGALNLAGLVSTACPNGCRFERRLVALSAGSWAVSTEGEMAISATPEQFTLAAGEAVTVTIDVEQGSVANGAWGRGAVVLEPAASSLSTQRLTVGARFGASELPELLALTSKANRGRLDVDLGVLPELPEAQFPSSALVRPQRDAFTLPTDPSNDNAFDRSAGLALALIDVDENALMLRAELRSDESPDADLFVGRDRNCNGQAEEDELVCSSRSPLSDERCLVSSPEAGAWWVLVQNWSGSGAAGGDEIELDWAVLRDQDDASFGVNGPGRHPGGELDVQLFADQPALRRDETWWAAFGVASGPDQPIDIGVVGVSLSREDDVVTLPTALFNGETRPVTLPPVGRHQRLFVDVPVAVDRLAVRVQGDDDIEADLRLKPYEALSDAFPSTPTASGPSLGNGSGSAAGYTLSVTDPAPGRYYVDLRNRADSERQVEVSVSLDESQRVEPRYGLWSPLFRGISQGIEWQRAGLGFLIWYSYDIDGLPIFYLATNRVDEGSSAWTSDLIRVTGGSNNRQHVETVGQVALTTISRDRVMFSWRLNGAHGAEIYNPDAPESCPEQGGSSLSYTGHWFSPGLSQGGTTVIVFEEGQFYVRYYYDGDGVGRWAAIVSTGPGPFADDFEVWSFRGFCPNCPDEVAPDHAVVGTYERSFTSESSGREVLDFVSRPPLNAPIRLDVPIEKLSEPLPCG
jgi:subtilisin family serine protease